MSGPLVRALIAHVDEEALARARARGIRVAVLKEDSPSCGPTYTYDGTFTGTKVSAPGVTAAKLREAGLHVFSEAQLDDAERVLRGALPPQRPKRRSSR
jgi:uncharacterized protein YbbK (DUF523 family)